MSLKISHSALAVAAALLSSTSLANSLRLLRSTCVFMQRFDGVVPITVSDSKWPNCLLESTASGLSAMGTRIGMRTPLRFPALAFGAAAFAARKVLAQFQLALGLGVDPLVEALVTDPHRRGRREHGLEPSRDELGTPAPAQRVQHEGAQLARIHAVWLARFTPARVGLPLRRQRAVERLERPRAGLQPRGPVGPVRLVFIGREPQATPQLAAHRGLVPADPLRGLPDAHMLLAMQLLDQDPFLGRQVRILLTHECSTFSS